MNKENRGNNATAGIGKKSDLSVLGSVKVHFDNTDPGVLEDAKQASLSAVHALAKGEFKRYYEVAESVTKAMAQRRGGAWHTVVGKSYGSFVTHEDRNMAYLSVGPVLIMTFKHG